jgi:hypothetical protein
MHEPIVDRHGPSSSSVAKYDGSFSGAAPARRKIGVLSHSKRRTVVEMSARLDPTWKVLSSPSTPAVDRCVDFFLRPDGTFGFEEFRRDPEDMGTWTPVAYYSGRVFTTEDDARTAACAAVPWLSSVLDDWR